MFNKVVGYLKDFEGLWSRHDQKPKAVLVLPGGVYPTDNAKWLHQEIALVSGNAYDGLKEIISHLLAQRAPSAGHEIGKPLCARV